MGIFNKSKSKQLNAMLDPNPQLQEEIAILRRDLSVMESQLNATFERKIRKLEAMYQTASSDAGSLGPQEDPAGELGDTTHHMLTTSFESDSAYYSICDPEQQSRAFALLLFIMCLLYLVLLPGVMPLIPDARSDNRVTNLLSEKVEFD